MEANIWELADSLEADLQVGAATAGGFVAVLQRSPGGFTLNDRLKRGGKKLRRLIPEKSNRPYPPWLVGPGEWGPDGAQHYEALAVPDLHRRFAALDDREGGLLRFANRYGFLGLTLLVHAKGDSANCFIAESLADWRYERGVMAYLLEIHDLVQRTNSAGPLSKLISWSESDELGTHVSISWPWEYPGRWIVASSTRSPQLLTRWRTGALAEPARYALIRAVNGYLHGHVSPLLLPFERRGDIVFRADSLLAAMYMQFALEISGKGRRPKLCKGCGTYFTPRRSNQAYCEPNCKNRAFYKRKTQNRQEPR